MNSPTSVTLTIAGQPVGLHAIQTGTIAVKTSHHTGCLPERSPLALRMAAILADRSFAAPMPIWTFAIEHPDGVYVIDAGATPEFNDDGSWERDRRGARLVRSFLRIAVEPSQTLPAQLSALGLDPAQVRAVILTHQHIDHTGAIPDLTGATVWTTQAEDNAADRIGAFSWRWRDDHTAVRHLDREGTTEPGDPPAFRAGVTLTHDQALRAFHTPGHTPGSVTARLTTDQGHVWFTGDTSFTAEHLHPTAPTAGIHTDPQAVRALHHALAGQPLLLPSHDPDNPTRIRQAGQSPQATPSTPGPSPA